MQPTDDSALLRQYVENHSDEAFATLVTRHLNLVYSVALRQVSQPQYAEEITQAVFIILAKKALPLRHERALSSWLFQTTRLTANNFLRSEARRHRREQEAYMQSVLNEPGEDAWQQIAPLLDSAVGALSQRDRRAIVLRFYEGRNLGEVGVALDISEDAAKKRITRALERLQRYFSRHGVNSTTTALAGMISANSVQAASPALAKSVITLATVKGVTASTSTLTLIKGALKIMAWTKAKTAITVGVGILLVVGTPIVVYRHAYQRPRILDAAQSQTTAISLMSDARQFGLGMLEYAHDHQNRFPANFDQMAAYLKNDPMLHTNLDQFEVTCPGLPSSLTNRSAIIIARQKQPFFVSNGKWAKVYEFADGHAEVRVGPDEHFEAYEREHMVSQSN